MNWEQLLIMRNELLLVAAALVILIGDLNSDPQNRRGFYIFSILIVSVVTIAGLFPAQKGELFGAMYLSDDVRIMMKNILNFSTLIILLQSWRWLSSPEQISRMAEYILLLLSTLIGMGYMISSGHFLMFYLGLELATIPLAALAAFETFRSKSAEAGIKFILLAAFSSGVILFGISYLYADIGSLYFDSLVSLEYASVLTPLGLIFILSGLGFKISLVPFHLWTADVYEGAPIGVTSYLSVVSKGAAIFILIVLLHTVFAELNYAWDPILYVIIIITITVGNLFAIRQRNIKRFLAFSSIAQAGFILLGILNPSNLGSGAVIYFVLVYVFSNLAAFGVASTIQSTTGKELIDDYRGFYRTNPRLSLVMMLAMFSLAGIPPVAGFFWEILPFHGCCR